MIERVIETVERHAMFRPGQRVGVGVSGGADSVCLAHVLVELAARWDLRLSVLHLNHGLRGPESDGDEAFVRELAGRLGLPFESQRWTGPAGPANLEEAAREARLAFFAAAIAGGLDRVAVGHTRSDQAETVLFRLLRGAGTAGLAGVRPVTGAGIVRPLLGLDRSEVRGFLEARGLPWREDATNGNLAFARNRIRHELLPQLARDWNPGISETLANTADWALAEEAWWEAELDRLEASHFRADGDGVVLEAAALRSLPLAAARRLARRAMERVKGDLRGIDFRHIAAVVEMAEGSEGHGRVQPAGLDVFRSFEWLRIGRPEAYSLATRDYGFDAPVPGAVPIPGNGTVIRLELLEKSDSLATRESVYNEQMGCIDWQRVSGPLQVRNWRPGDHYQPKGSSGESKLKALFQEARIPLWERRHWPLLTDGSAIVWARRFGPAAGYVAEPGARRVLAVWETSGAG